MGIDDIDGTVIEQRIKDVMAMGSKKNQTYTPRQGGTNRNMKNYLPEQLEYTKEYNEDLFHIFGYVKDDERIPDNNTPFLDYEGKAKPENVAKTNYYRELNKRAMQKRRNIATGDLAADHMKYPIGPGTEGAIKMITELNIMPELTVMEHF